MDYFNKFDFRNHDKTIPNEVDCFFTKQQLEEMSEYEKSRLKNLRQNYEVMVLMGLPVKKPSFMTAKWKKKKPVVVESESESDEEWKPSKRQKKKTKALKPFNPFKAPFNTRPVSSTVTSQTKTGPVSSTVTSQKPKTSRKKRAASSTITKQEDEMSDCEEKKPRYALRQRNRNFMNVEVPDDDEFIYCEDCNKEYPGDCPVHGAYIIIENAQIELIGKKDCNRCFKTLPHGIEIKESNIPNAGKGAFATKHFVNRSRFGPYGGEITKDTEMAHSSGYCWQIYQDGKHNHFIDAQNPATSNWMRYVNCARTESEQNVTAYQYQGQIYYRTFKDILPGAEILVWYGSEYASELGIHRPLWSKSTFKAFHSEAKKVSIPTSQYPWRLNGLKPAISDVYPCLYCKVSYASPNLLLRHTYYAHYEVLDIQQLLCHCPDMARLGKMSHEDSKKLIEVIHNMNKPTDNVTGNQSLKNEGNNKSIKPKPDEYSPLQSFKRKINNTQNLSQKSTAQNITEQDKQFQCKFCDQSFTNSSKYHKHRRTHNKYKNNKCNICNKTFSSTNYLQTHMRIHTGDKPYKCNVCSKSCIQNSDLQKHMRIHTGDKCYKCYKCDVCSKSFNQTCNLQTHMRIHTGEKPYKCNVCSKSFNQSSSLQTHMRIHTGDKPYKCDVCSKSFDQNGNLQTHMRIHTGDKPYKCDICNKSFDQSSNLQGHMRSHTGDKPYTCDVCSKSFGYNHHLQGHMRIHTGEKPYKCDVCSKSFDQNSNLKTHMRIHTRDKPYKCDVCCKSFNTSGNLQTHMKIHTGDKPYKCDACSKSFGHNHHLQRHMIIHTGDKLYKCDVCIKSFSNKNKCDVCCKSFNTSGNLQTHMKIHTGDKPYKCDACSKSFGHNHHLQRHMIIHTGDKLYKCDVCIKSFSNKKSLELHIETSHSRQNEL